MSTSQPETENEPSQKEKSHLEGDMKPMLNGFTESSQASSNGNIGPKENGDVSNKVSSKSSQKPSDGHHVSSSKNHSSSDREKHHSSSSSKHSSSTKHGSSSSSSKDKSSSSSSRPKEGHSSSSSSSKHKEGSSSKHSSSGSSSKSKEHGSSSDTRADKDKSNSSSSKPKDSSSSSSNKHVSSSSDKHKENSSKHGEGGSSGSSSKHSGSSKTKDSSSSDKNKSASSSSNKMRDDHREKSSSRSDKHSSSSSDKPKSSSLSSSPSKHHEGEKSKVSNEADKHKLMAKSDKEKHSSSQSKDEIKIKKEVDAEAAPSINGDCKPCASIQMDMALKLEDCVKGNSPKKSPVKLERMEVEDDQSEDDDDEKPLSLRKKETKPIKRQHQSSDYEDEEEEEHDYDDEEEDEDSDVPLSIRNKKKQKLDIKPVKKEIKTEVKKEMKKGVKKEIKKEAPASKAKKREHQEETSDEPSKKKKKDEEQEVWRCGNPRWEEKGEDNGIKWTFLQHKGPVFAAPYEPLPKNVRFYYDGKPMQLSPAAEEVASFYGRMLDHEYTSRDVFNNNFMSDWRKLMTAEEKAKITNLKLCNFTEINDHFKRRSEEKKNKSKEEKQLLKKENEAIIKEYGFCDIDHHIERIGNFRIEPPDLFRGRGNHPKMGCIKKRINPEDVIINCSKDSIIPKAPPGHKWKEVRHDNTVTWLACWTANVLGSTKYVMLNAASKLKGQKDWQKYEVARKLHGCVDRIRAQYQDDWKSKEMRVRQRAVALYFIDKLALRAGNEKEEGETADTVGCCSLRVEHIKLHQEKDGKQHVVEFDFLGKDSIRYYNAIPVEKRVFKNLELFMENKQPEDDLFDRLGTTILNKYLQDLMEGLTAKVFRTFNASKTLSEQLELLTNPNDSVAAKLLSYNRANRAVAILCNHQRSVPKTFEKSMENLQKKIDSKKSELKQVKKEIKEIKADYKREKSVKTKALYDKKKNTQKRLEDQLNRLEVQATDKDENKEIALGTSKLNYLDPRISVAWCKKFGVPIEKVYNKTQRDKFRWAIDMTDELFKF